MLLSAEQQADILRRLEQAYASDHPCTVKLLGVKYKEQGHVGCIIIATEYMDCGSLKDLAKLSEGRLPEEVLGKASGEVLRGLEYLSTVRKIIHRDIKPSNLLINSAGQVKITDFGLAGQGQVARTWLGSQPYMAPERVSGLDYTSLCDVWSLGIALCELATGKNPYEDVINKDKPMDLLDRIFTGEPPNVPDDAFSPEFCDFLRHCLQKNSEHRPQPTHLLSHPWVQRCQSFDLAGWVVVWRAALLCVHVFSSGVRARVYYILAADQMHALLCGAGTSRMPTPWSPRRKWRPSRRPRRRPRRQQPCTFHPTD